MGADPAQGQATPNLSGISTDIEVLAFDGVTDELVGWAMMIPSDYNGGDITLKVPGATSSATTNSVCFCAESGDVADGASIDSATDENSSCDSNTMTNTNEEQSTFSYTLSGTHAAGNVMYFNLLRDADGTSCTDDYTSDFYIFNANICFPVSE
jgi:hypothetical protein